MMDEPTIYLQNIRVLESPTFPNYIPSWVVILTLIIARYKLYYSWKDEFQSVATNRINVGVVLSIAYTISKRYIWLLSILICLIG